MLPTLDPTKLTSRPLGSGCHRSGHLLEIGDTAFCVKVADYRPANLKEAEGWSDVQGTDDEDLFCEVIAASADGRWLVMPLCQPLAYDADTGSVPEGLDASWRPLNGYSDDVVHQDYLDWIKSGDGKRAAEITIDLHPWNVMRHPDGRLVVTDYGFGAFVGEEAYWGNEDSYDEPETSCDGYCCR